MLFMNSISNKIVNFCIRHTILILSIILVFFSVLTRSATIGSHLFFGFEQGRDAFRVKSILNLSDIVIVGPKTDIDGIFHGPWYYYLMTIPYLLGNGDPRIAVIFLISIGAIIPVVFFVWWTQLSKNILVSFIFAVLTAASFELMVYSRWLSNVSPALPFFTVGMFFLWQFLSSKKSKWIILSSCLFGLACQFEIVMTFWLVVGFVVLFLTKNLVVSSKKTFILMIGAFAIWFLPLLVFNIKYDWLSVRSILLLIKHQDVEVSRLESITLYGNMMFRLWNETVLFLPTLPALITILPTIIGLIFLWKKEKGFRKMINMLACLIVGTVPVLLFSHSAHLVQVYAGFGVVLLQLFFVSLWYWMKKIQVMRTYLKLTLTTLIGITCLFSVVRSFVYLWSDRGTFYRTIQEDLNFSDQLKIVEYIKAETSHTDDYFLKAFTIPYYQEEGWQYLHEKFIGKKLNPGAQKIYLVIEERVDPYWEKRWINDLGNTTLISEKKFGRIRLQERSR